MMKKKNLQNLLLLLVALVGLQATAAIPSGYYTSALGKSDQELMLALHQKIRNHYMIYYGNLWEKFKTTDYDGTYIIDRYADTHFTYSTDQCSSGYSGVGDCYNREHSVPNSWWGGDQDTMYTDLYHVYPVDGWVNHERENYPFGDCANGTPKGTGKLGTCTHSGYTGKVFEVADEYKGDFARSYFYMLVRYMDRVGSWTNGLGSVVFTNSSYKHLTPWAISQLLEWHRNDPVSTLESNRNEAVYGIQHNRNPFIDHPELVEFLWGDRAGTAWTGSTSTDPVISSPTNGSTINVGTNTGSGVTKSISVKGVYLTKSVTVSVTGTGFSVTPTTLTATAVNNGTTVNVTYNGTATNATGRLTISSTEVSCSATLTANYNPGGSSGGTETIETWEGCNGYNNYNDKDVQGHALAWHFTNAGLFAQSGDHWNDANGCRFGKNTNSSIMMTEDVTDGASKMTFYAASYGSDATATVQLQYSTDGGSNWTTAGTCSPNSTWQQYIFNLSLTGNVRFKIQQTAGSRLNIDDIAITSSTTTPVTNPEITAPVNGSTVDVGTIIGGATQVSTTIAVKGNDLTKPMTVRTTGSGFSVTPTILTAANVNAGTTVTVTYTATETGSATGTLTINSTEVSVTVNLTAAKQAMPTISISAIDPINAILNGDSPQMMGTVVADDNNEPITLTVTEGFQLSLNRQTWLNSLTLDPSGEVFYVRLTSTATEGEFFGTVTASTSLVNAYADVVGVVQPLVGDVNLDGLVNVTDATILVNYLLGGTPSPFSDYAADVNGDGFINVTDATTLINRLLSSALFVNKPKWDAVPVMGGIEVESNVDEPLEVYDMDGNCVSTVPANASNVAIGLPAGIYMVTSDTASRKVVVK